MPNDFYTPTGNPADNSNIVSADMRAEFAAINAGFNKLPTLTGNANKLVAVNSSASGLDVCSTIEIGGTGKTLSLTGEGNSFIEISSFGSTPIVRAGGGGSYLQLDDVRLIGTIQFSSGNTWVWEPGSVFASRGIYDSAGARVLTISGSGVNSITIVNSATNPTISTSAGSNLVVSSDTGNVAIGGTAYATCGLLVSGTGAAARITISDHATLPSIASSSSLLKLDANTQATGYLWANSDDGIPAGGNAALGVFFCNTTTGIYVGTGAPSVTAANGSLYMRADGAAGSSLYQRIAGAWVANT